MCASSSNPAFRCLRVSETISLSTNSRAMETIACFYSRFSPTSIRFPGAKPAHRRNSFKLSRNKESPMAWLPYIMHTFRSFRIPFEAGGCLQRVHLVCSRRRPMQCRAGLMLYPESACYIRKRRHHAMIYNALMRINV